MTRFRPLRWSAFVVASVLSYSIATQLDITIPHRILERFYATLHAASWSVVSDINSTSDGSTGPYKVPTGSGTKNTIGADAYACVTSYYEAGHTLAAGDLTDVSGNSYSLSSLQAAAGDGASKLGVFYKLAPMTNSAEQWTLTMAPGTSNSGIACVSITGSDGTTAPSFASSGATSSTPSGGSLGTAGQFMLTGVGNYAVGVSSIGSSFQILQNHQYNGGQNMGIAIAWQNLVGGIAGSANPQWTMTAGPTAVEVFNVVFTPSSGGSSPKPCLLLTLGVGGC